MNDRCYNSNKENYSRYGGRGITVCGSWKDSFETFYKDTHEEYDRLMELYDKSKVRFILLDRKGIYEPNNCKWIARVKK